MTGCGKPDGMGQAIARALADDAISLVITDVQPAGVANDRQRLLGLARGAGIDAFADELRAEGCRVETVLGDISDPREAQSMVDTAIATFGQLDILVNNAAAPQGADRQDIEDVPLDVFNRVIDVNLRGTFHMCRAAVPHMRRRRYGRIVNISSMAGLTAAPWSVAYSASKAGIIGLTRALSMDVGPWGITVNALCPGLVATSRAIMDPSPDLDVDETLRMRGRAIPVGRVGATADIAAAARFLASPESGYITGQALPIDGGGLTPFPLRQPEPAESGTIEQKEKVS